MIIRVDGTSWQKSYIASQLKNSIMETEDDDYGPIKRRIWVISEDLAESISVC